MDYFIYDLPFKERSELVSLLNAQDAWYELGGHCLGYNITQLSNFRSRSTSKRGETPADLLLLHWGQRNRTVGELFLYLRKLQFFQAMSVIQNYVPQKLHKLLDQPTTPEPIMSTMSPTHQASAFPVPYHIPQNKIVENNLNQSEAKTVYETYRPSESISISKPAQSNNCSNWVPSKNLKIRNDTPNIALNIPSNVYNIRGGSSPGEGTLQGSSSLMKRSPSGLPVNESGVWLNEVSFEELRSACNNFDMESNLLGRGGFGEVYRGVWNGQEVAVKRIREDKRRVLGSEEFEKCISQMIMELRTLMSFPARNILPLMAYSYDETFKTDPCLVYQLMANGSLADRLRCRSNTDVLTWEQRISIATGTACGLVYLHANQITHVDIKSPNILLDEYLEPKIGDFGLVRWLDQSAENSYRIVSSVQGTAPYLPDDYIRSKQLTPAVDTFCFGIVLFELITAKSPSWQDPVSKYRMRDIMLKKTCDLEMWVDPKLSNCGWSKSLFIIGQLCAVSNRKQRPEMKQVFEALKKLSEFNTPPNYEKNLYHPSQGTNMTDFTNQMSECLSAKEPKLLPLGTIPSVQSSNKKQKDTSKNIPLVIQGQVSSSARMSDQRDDSSSSNVSNSGSSSNISQSNTFSLTSNASQNKASTPRSGEYNIPKISCILNPTDDGIPDLSNLRVKSPEDKSEVIIPDLSILAFDDGIPNLSNLDTSSSARNNPSFPQSQLNTNMNSSILNKLKQMDKIDNGLCNSKLESIQRSIDSCQNVDDIL